MGSSAPASSTDPLVKRRTGAYIGCGAAAAAAAAAGTGALLWLLALLGVPAPLGLIFALLALCVAGGAWYGYSLASTRAIPRRGYERIIVGLLFSCAAVAVLVTVGIVYTVLTEALQFFAKVPPQEFFFGLEWSPQIAIRADQAGASGAFGVIPLLAGTLLISLIAMLVCVPVGLLAALYMSEFAAPQVRNRVKPCLEFLAGVPTVVYGFFAVATLSPLLRELGGAAGFSVAGESALAAGLVIGVMTIPFVASLSEDALFAVPQDLRSGALALGATRGEAALQVALPAALPGIMASCLLAFSRAIGETMIVVMAAGLSANLTINPLEAVTTVTVQIVTLLVGDQTFDDPKTLAAFALGLVLFIATLALNFVALHTVRKYQERYD